MTSTEALTFTKCCTATMATELLADHVNNGHPDVLYVSSGQMESTHAAVIVPFSRVLFAVAATLVRSGHRDRVPPPAKRSLRDIPSRVARLRCVPSWRVRKTRGLRFSSFSSRVQPFHDFSILFVWDLCPAEPSSGYRVGREHGNRFAIRGSQLKEGGGAGVFICLVFSCFKSQPLPIREHHRNFVHAEILCQS